MPDGDNSYYTDRLGPPDGRNADGLGAERSFPTLTSANPAGRLDLHVTGWYEKYIIQDLITQVEQMHIGTENLVDVDKRRFIMGTSMGGTGSLKLALKHQDKFKAAASLSGFLAIRSISTYVFNLAGPAMLDVFGSAPLAFDATSQEVEANVHLDDAYIAANNPPELIEALSEINLSFFVEVGANDEIDFFTGHIAATEDFVTALEAKGVTVEGRVVPAATDAEPNNGNAMHALSFFRTRLGAILKFFSDIYQEEATYTIK